MSDAAPARLPWAEVLELLRDAARCPRLSPWEQAFVRDLQGRLGPIWATGEPKFETRFSDKQHAVLRRIQEKVYAT